MSQNQSKIRILLRGDDVGMNRAVNDAFVKVIEAGLLKNAGLLVPAPGAREAVERLMPLRDRVCLGVHGAITSEWDRLKWGPVLDLHKVPTLHDQNGHFFPNTQEVHKHFLVQDVERELRGQIRLAKSWGYEPQYMDHHMAYHWIEELQPALRKIAEDNGLYTELNSLKMKRLPKEVVHALIHERDFSQLSQIEPGDYLWVFHPGGVPEEMGGLRIDAEQQREIVEKRWIETQFLCDPDALRAFQDAGIELLTYAQLAEEQGAAR